MRNPLLVSIVFIAGLLNAFSYPKIAVESILEKNYNYKEWSGDEERMLRVMLVDKHNDTGSALSADEQFAYDNHILRSQIIKEMLYAEDFSNHLGIFMVRLHLTELTYAFTSIEIVKMMEDNIHKIEKGEVNDSSEGMATKMLQMIMKYGTEEDVALIDRIGRILPESYSGRINKYKEIMKARTQRVLSAWEEANKSEEKDISPEAMSVRKLLSKNELISESFSVKKDEAKVSEEIESTEEKQTFFPWWIIGLVVLLAIVFFILKGKNKR